MNGRGTSRSRRIAPINALLTKLLKAGDPSRRSRFHTARDEVITLSAGLHFPFTIGYILLPRLTPWRPRIPWIPFTAIRALSRHLTAFSSVVEIGSGMSTLWLASRCQRLVSIEADKEWFARVQAKLQQHGCRNVDLRYRWVADAMSDFGEFADGSLDLVIVDGGPRETCLDAALPKVRAGGAVYVDNTDEPHISGDCRERLQEAAARTGGELRFFRDFSPGNLFASEGALLILP